VEGESGIVNVLHRYGQLKKWNRSLGEITLVNESRIKLFSGEEPDRLRGPQHHYVWLDEIAAFEYGTEAWDMMVMGLRLGDHPQAVATSTPKPVPLVRTLLNRKDGSVMVTRGSTYDNADNLAPTFLAELMSRYEGTRLGKQEIMGELLEDVEGALWSLDKIEATRISEVPQLVRTVVAVDPAVTDTGDETGIIVAGRDTHQHGYVIADYTTRGTPDAWARRVVETYDTHMADAVVVEINQGGQMVAQVLRTVRPSLPIVEVRASKGKQTRAEPISALYEQGRIHHVGVFPQLESQLTTWTPDDPKSPDRLDALVWAFTELIQHSGALTYLQAIAKMCPCGYPNKKTAVFCESCRQPLPV
jgi:predicted phage terminase large subunit-like protein